MIEIFRISLKDFLSKKFLTLSFLPLIISIFILGCFLFFGANELYNALKEGASSGDFSFLDEDRFPLIAKILSYKITIWIITALFYMTGSFLVLMISVFIALIVAGFLTPVISQEINKRHYQTPLNSEVSMIRSLKLMAVEIFKFLGILIITLPFLFVPIVNLFVINIPFFYIYYKFLLIDVASSSLSSEKFELFYKKGGGYLFITATFCFYLISLIPLVGLFLQLFFIIYLTHVTYRNKFLKHKFSIK